MPLLAISMTVERSLQWAYGFELPKVNSAVTHGAINSQWEGLLAYASGGFYTSHSAWTGGGELAYDRPHPDALALHNAVVELGVADAPPHDEAALLVGFRGFDLDARTAFANAWAKVGLDVIRHAKLKSRPEIEGPPRARPARYLNGNVITLKPSRVRQKRDADNVYQTDVPVSPRRNGQFDPGSFCPLRWAPDPKHVLRDRAEHAAWVNALDLIVSIVIPRLSSLSLESVSLDCHPWLRSGSFEQQSRRIIHSLISEPQQQPKNVRKPRRAKRLNASAPVA